MTVWPATVAIASERRLRAELGGRTSTTTVTVAVASKPSGSATVYSKESVPTKPASALNRQPPRSPHSTDPCAG